MHLVAPLAAGVKGAENGIAELYQRGTTVPAEYRFVFESGDIHTEPVALDSFGGAVIYTDDLTTIVVKTSGGAVLREFVAGAHDHSVEVISESFLGTDYDTAAYGPGNPTNLGWILDRWVAINGGVDWQVAVPGGVSTIQGAIANSYGLVYNVKAYGALGDGVANDTTPINSAIAAADAGGGGIVYFPPGTYRTTGSVGIGGAVSLIGAGTNATALVVDNPAAARLLTINTHANAERFPLVANMRMASIVPITGQLVRLNTGSKVIFDNVLLDGTNCADDMINTVSAHPSTEFIAVACNFILGVGSAIATQTIRRAILRDCKFITPANYPAQVIVSAKPVELSGCLFVNSATTSGTYSCVRQQTTHDMRVHNCKFLAAAGATVTAIDIGTYEAVSQVSESGNIFALGVTAYAYNATPAARGASIALHSREHRSIFITDNTAAPSLPLDQYGLVVFSSTNTAIVFAAANRPPDGARGTIVLYHPSGGAGTAIAGANFLNPASVATANLGGYLWEYRVCTPLSTVRMALTIDGRSLGVAM